MIQKCQPHVEQSCTHGSDLKKIVLNQQWHFPQAKGILQWMSLIWSLKQSVSGPQHK